MQPLSLSPAGWRLFNKLSSNQAESP